MLPFLFVNGGGVADSVLRGDKSGGVSGGAVRCVRHLVEVMASK